MKYSINKYIFLIVTAFSIFIFSLTAGELDVNDDGKINILILGSTVSYSDGNESGVVKQKAFNPSVIDNRLKSILDQDPLVSQTVNVVFEDIHKIKTNVDTAIGGGGSNWVFDYHCYSLMQHFVWPEGKTARMANLRGAGTRTNEHLWDYIVLCEDPYVMANFPGVYAEGVKMIQSEVSKGSAKLVLLGQWPENSSSFSATDFNEIVYRVGNSDGIMVVPAGKVWDAYTSQDSSTTKHPTTRGEYLAAASIYSKLVNRTANGLGYSYGNAIANHALSIVQTNNNANQYSGSYDEINAFQMNFLQKRQLDFIDYGSSTEAGFLNGLKAAFDMSNHAYVRRNPPTSGNPVDFNYSRGTDVFEASKQYQVNSAKHEYAYGFPMGDHRNTGAVTMVYGIDKRFIGSSFYNGTDLGVAYSMVREGEIPQKTRALPVRLLWSKINHFQPTINSHRDGWHLSNELDRAVGAYIYTTTTGRCPVEAEPADTTSNTWKQWYCRKLGYETAWQMAHLTTRAPGFRVMPSSKTALSVTPTTTETMTVQFVNPPDSNVTVTISSSNNGAAIVSPRTLTFTPQNYNIPQDVIVAGIPGSSASNNFNVLFSTSSADEVYDGVTDSWAYSTTRSNTSVSQSDNGMTAKTTTQNQPVTVNLNASGSNAGNTVIAGPANGSISWVGSDVLYTPDFNYIGTDEFAYAVTNGSTQTIGYVRITIGVATGQINVVASDASAAEEGQNTGSWTISRQGDTTDAITVFYSIGGSADSGLDYTISHTSTVNIPAGQNSVTITLTPIDDIVFGEGNETAVLMISANANYPIGNGSATITISDNDNNLPVVNAGTDQTIVAIDTGVWTPTKLSTAMWLDASDASTITSSTGKISQWNDKSTNGNHATQTDSNNRPTTGSRVINGKNSIGFKAAETQLLNMPVVDVIGKEVWSVFVTDNYTATPSQILVGGNDNVQIGVHSSTQKLRLWQGANPYSSDTTSSVTVPASTPTLAGWLAHTNTKKFSINGVIEDTGNTYNNGSINANQIGKGQYAYMEGAIGEIIITNGVLPVENRQKMEGYLAHKWGLEAKLPGTHPHKASAPGDLGAVANLDGTVSDPDGNSLTTTWSLVSGPNSVSFGNAAAIDTTATFSTLGVYTLRLAVNDGSDEVFDDVVITVTDGDDNNPPVVNAGTDQTISSNGSGIWSPLAMATAVWLDANDASTITENSGNLSLWQDKSGNNRHAAQGTVANQPTLTANGLNGKNIINFNGSSSYFNVYLDMLAGVSHSSFIVTKTTNYTDIYGAANASAGANSLHVGFNGANYRMNYWSNDFGPTRTSNFDSTGANLLNYVWTSGTGKKILANGISEGSNSNAGNIGTMSGGGRLGKVVNHGYYGGDIAEFIIITGAVSLVDRQKMEGYLAHKWGLEAHLPAGHPHKASAPVSAGAIAHLDGSVTDENGDPLTTIWSMVSGPGSVSFGDASAVDTTAIFSSIGTYVLRLTANDGLGAVLDEVTITVTTTSPYNTWSGGNFDKPFTDTSPNSDPDGDGLNNQQEFAFGTDPTLNNAGSLALDGSAHGLPVPVSSNGGNTFDYYFLRRKDHAISGSITYTAQFSSDLLSFLSSTETPTVVVESLVHSDYEVVKIPYPAGTQFGRIKTKVTP